MLKAIRDENTFSIDLEDGASHGKMDGTSFEWDVLSVKPGSYHVIRDNVSYNVEVLKADKTTKEYTIEVNGHKYEINLKDRYDELLERLGMEDLQGSKEKEIKAPMPGLVLDVLVEPGQEVSQDEPVVVLEAMKMENVLKAPIDGVIKSVNTSKSSPVEKNETLIELE